MTHELWQKRAALPGLQAVLDPLDRRGAKNRYIDYLHRHALERGLDLQPGQRVLDLGCGVGRLSSWLARDARQVVGVDISPAMLSAARRATASPNPSFVRYANEALPFADGTFDRVVSVFVLQHVSDERQLGALLAEIDRITRDGGRVAIIEQVRRRSDEVAGYIKHRTHQAYVQNFAEHGFRSIADKPIRAPAGWSAAAGRGLLPERAWPVASRIDQWIASAAGERLTYTDRLIVFEKTTRP